MSRPPFNAVVGAIIRAGGRPFMVGGAVRDMVLNKTSKDTDVEVFNLPLSSLEAVLGQFGTVNRVGQSFGILKLQGLPEVDFSIPRRDNKVGAGHRGFDAVLDPNMTIAEAARRRDLTMNSMAMDLDTGEIIDSFGGMQDIRAARLRMTDPASFLDDPLRALRVAQFISRFGMAPDRDLHDTCGRADLSELPGERIFAEFDKLIHGSRPAQGLAFLASSGLLRFFPQLQALTGCVQDAIWHPEGSVWNHTLLAVAEAATRTEDVVVRWAALCHDLGKPTTTEERNGRIISHGHEQAGELPTRQLLEDMRAPQALVEAVVALVVDHLAPHHFTAGHAGMPAFRRLARRLAAAQVTPQQLMVLAQSDHHGRENVSGLETLAFFAEGIERLSKEPESVRDVVLGRHVIARGIRPGPQVGEILASCREVQIELGLTDPERILSLVLDAK